MNIKQTFLLICILLVSCLEKDQITHPPLLQLDLSRDKEEATYLSDITDSIQYLILDIPEKYNEEKGRVSFYNIHFSGKYIIGFITFIPDLAPLDWHTPGLIYNKEDGKYIGEVLEKKESKPDKENLIHYFGFSQSPFIFNESGDAFITGMHKEGTSTTQFALWDIARQEPVEIIDVKPVFSEVAFLKDKNILQFETNAQGKGENKISIHNKKGKLLFQNKHTQRFTPAVKDFGVGVDFFKINDTFYYLDINDTIAYGIDSKLNHFPAFSFYLGEKSRPYYYEYKTPEHESDNSLARILTITANNHYLFFRFWKDWEVSFGMYDLSQKHVSLFNNNSDKQRDYSSKKGIRNDIDGGVPFWPNMANEENELISLYPKRIGELQKNLEQFSAEGVKDIEAHQRFIRLIKEANPSSYIVTIIKTKQK